MTKKRNQELADLAKKVRLKRHERELTQFELAEKADLHVNYIGGIERAAYNPTYLSLLALAKALQCSPKDLMP